MRTNAGLWPIARCPRFRKQLFLRETAFDHDGATSSRFTTTFILPSLLLDKLGLSVYEDFRGSIPFPIGFLSTLQTMRRRMTCKTRYRPTRYGLCRTELSSASSFQLVLAHPALLNRIQFRRIRRKELELCPSRFNRFMNKPSAITSNLTRRDQLNRLQTLPARAE